MDDKLVQGLRDICLAVIEQCAQAVEEIPASEEALEFKKRALDEIRGLAESP